MTRVLFLLVFVPLAAEARFRRPFNIERNITAHYDNDRRSGPMLDYACGQHTYDNHTGSDFGVYFTDIVAVANGVVLASWQGCQDYGFYGNTCGDRCGNGIRLRLDDGTVALYCHLKNGSFVVGNGQRVSCGQKLAVSASSGSSTGPHLHLTWLRGGVLADNYRGQCTSSPGSWVGQRGYIESPTADCENPCDCSPGQVQDQGCGRCGAQRRTCGGDCHWGGWGGCGGEGPCSPGQVEDNACCDCGRTRRSCNGACQWTGWSACAGPDPAGTPACDTGKLGVCKDGTTRCVNGCKACVQTTAASSETCDDRDNDCDGATDEDSPRVVADPPPAFAAALVDLSFPKHLPPGGRGEAWVVFRNVGRTTWKARELSLRADATLEGHPSLLIPPAGWRAFDTPAVLDADVPHGAAATLLFPVAMPPGGEADVNESFSLVAPSGKAIACPEASLGLGVASVEVRVGVAATPDEPATGARDDGCSHAAVAAWTLVLLYRRRRRVADATPPGGRRETRI